MIFSLDGDTSEVTGAPRKPSLPQNITGVVEETLGISGGFVVNVDDEVGLTRRNEAFVARITVIIEGVSYTIVLSGPTSDLSDFVYLGMQHPFVGVENGDHTLSLSSIPGRFFEANMDWALQDSYGETLTTNQTFWGQIRYRIPASSTLSKNKAH